MESRAWLILFVLAGAHAADPTKPHPNRGVNPPFKAGAPDIALSAADLDTIARGKTIQRQMVNKETGSGTALAILDVDAPVSVVLDRILDFKAYPEMVSGVSACSNYAEVTHPNGTQTLMTHMVIKAAILKFTGYFHHTYYPTLNSVTWTLDYDRTSDFTDSVGYWHVAPHPLRPHTEARVFYSVNLLPGELVPGFVVDILQKQALSQATAWVKFESEKRAPPPKPAAKGASDGGGGGAPSLAVRNSLRCVWWDLHADLLHENGRPAECTAPAPSQHAIAEPGAESWSAWALSLVGS